MRIAIRIIGCLVGGTLAVGLALASGPASQAAPASKPADNLSYWLGQAKPADSRPAAEGNALEAGKNPFGTDENFRRQDALPGVIQLSDGQVLAGYMFTTAEKDWMVWDEPQKRWRRVPFLAALSISAVVMEEKMEQVWRWKEMGVPERVYTGEEYPTRRLEWRFHLIDGSEVTGAVKGQPIWIEIAGKAGAGVSAPGDANAGASASDGAVRKAGPFVLHETVKGKIGEKLADLVTVRKIIVSRRLLDQFRRP